MQKLRYCENVWPSSTTVQVLLVSLLISKITVFFLKKKHFFALRAVLKD